MDEKKDLVAKLLAYANENRRKAELLEYAAKLQEIGYQTDQDALSQAIETARKALEDQYSFKFASLTAENDALNTENATLKSKVEEQENKIQELVKEIPTEPSAVVEELPIETSVESAEVAETLTEVPTETVDTTMENIIEEPVTP